MPRVFEAADSLPTQSPCGKSPQGTPPAIPWFGVPPYYRGVFELRPDEEDDDPDQTPVPGEGDAR